MAAAGTWEPCDRAHPVDPGHAPVTALLVGHQGGWDEILFVLLPIVLFAGLLAIANRRAGRALAAQEPADTTTPSPDAE